MKEINFDLINKLYMEWLNESNPFMQRKRKDDIKSRFSPYEFLMYSTRYALPFEAFRNVFPLSDLFRTLEEMKKQGQDISFLTSQALVIDSIEDVQALNRFSQKETSSEIENFRLRFEGNNIFQYGNIKDIGQKFPNACANYCELQQVEQMLKAPRDYKGIPIILTIDNIGQLPIEKLNYIEKHFDVVGIRIIEKDRQIRRHQGEQNPLSSSVYKEIRTIIDDEIISKLYVSENANRTHVDYQLATQILCNLADRIEYDSDTRYKIVNDLDTRDIKFSNEVAKSSSLIGLLTGKSICTGYSEILRNVLSCVGIEGTVIIGKTTNGTEHAWNQIQLGNTWFNTDLTLAKNKIREGKPTGDLFMSDIAFFGDRREMTFDKGKEKNGISIESTVEVGGHEKAYGVNHKICECYISPYLTSSLIERSKHYDESCKGLTPYVGSSIEKMRSSSNPCMVFEH